MSYDLGWSQYMGFAPQDGRLVGPLAVDSPTASVVSLAAGPCTAPALQRNEGTASQSLVGAMCPVAQYPGRREVSLSTTLQVNSKEFLTYALRDHSALRSSEAPYGAASTCRGLRYLTVETGHDQHYEAGAGNSQYVDALFLSLALSYDESKPVQAQCDLWAPCDVVNPTPGTAWTLLDGVYAWRGLDATLGVADIRERIQRVGVNVSNNLRRAGWRNQIMSGGVETALSRTCRAIIPGPETVTVSFHLYDMTDGEVASWRWGTLVLTATTAYESMEVELDMLRISRYSRPSVSPNGVVTYQTEGLAGVVTIN